MQDDKQKYKLLSQKDEKIVRDVESFVKYAESSTQDLRAQWEEIWKLWVQYDKGANPFQSNKRLNIARRAVDTLAAFLVARQPTFNALPKGIGDEIKARLIKELLQHQAKRNDMLDLQRKAKIGVKSATLFGAGFFKVYWRTDLDKEKKVTFDDPVLENVHIMDFYADPYIGTMQGQPKIVQRFVLPIETLRDNKNYRVPREMKPTYTDGDTKQSNSSVFDQYDLNVGNGDKEVQGKVEVWECWTKKYVYTIGDPDGQPVMLRKMKNPYGFIPFVKMDYELEPVPNRFYGSGSIGPNVKINKAIDEVLNNIIDNIRIIINPMYQVRRGANIDPRQLVSRPAGFVSVEQIGADVAPLITPDTTGAGLNLFGLLTSQWQTGTAVTSVRGGGAGDAGSATEASIQQENADVVTNAVKANFELALSEIGEMVAKLNIKFMDQSRSLRIFNPELVAELLDRETRIVLDNEEIERVLATGQYAGMFLTPEDLQEVASSGEIPPTALTIEDREKIKQFGQLIKFGSSAIDVEVDVEVEADSTVNQDNNVIRKQFLDFVNTNAQMGINPDPIMFAKKFSELSGISGLDKLYPEMNQLPITPEEEAELQQLEQLQAGGGAGVPPIDGQNTEQGIQQSVNAANFQV